MRYDQFLFWVDIIHLVPSFDYTLIGQVFVLVMFLVENNYLLFRSEHLLNLPNWFPANGQL